MKGHADLKGQIADTHFTWEEARCNHCGMLPDNPQVIINTANFMEKIREHLGGQPVRVNSWFRCPDYNRRIGGASNSQHTLGYAVDFVVKHLSPRQVQRKLRSLFGAGKLIQGLGCYPGFTHVDRRTTGPATWNG